MWIKEFQPSFNQPQMQEFHINVNTKTNKVFQLQQTMAVFWFYPEFCTPRKKKKGI